MIDSHCHLDVDTFLLDRDSVIARAADVGVTDIVVPGVDEASWSAIRELARTVPRPRCHVALGIHPVALPLMDPANDDAVMGRLAADYAGAIAIGECGLDTSIDLAAAPMERQERVLRAQLALARQANLPVILHARGPGCYALLLEFLKKEPLPQSGGVLHSYGGGADLLRKFLEFQLCFGFAGPATYHSARKVRASIALVPSDRLLAETDAPDQTPEPHRPGRSEPAYVADVIVGLAAARGESVASVREQTSANARRLFNLA